MRSLASLGPRLQINDVEEVALLLCAGRRVFTRHHAHESDVVGAIAYDLQRLHQALQAIAFDRELLLDLGRGTRAAFVRRRGRLGRRFAFSGGRCCFAVGRRFFGRRSRFRFRGSNRFRLGRRSRFRFGRRFRRRRRFGVRRRSRFRFGRSFAFGRRSRFRFGRSFAFGGRSRFGRSFAFGGRSRFRFAFGRRGYRGLFGLRLRARLDGRLHGTVGATDDRRLAQEGAGELSDGFHGRASGGRASRATSYRALRAS